MASSEDKPATGEVREEGDGEEFGFITVNVQTPKERKAIKAERKSSIIEFKRKVSMKFNNTPIDQLLLIFSGKILKDNETLESYGIKDNTTTHLVVRSSSSSRNTNAGNNSREQQRNERVSTPHPVNPAPTNEAAPPRRGPFGGLVESIFMSNPQMRQLMERNPEINHMLNNPDILRQTMEIARNPNMMQELMRNQDRAMSNLESIPGGQSALQRMYRDIQEPMLNAAQDQFGSNPFQALSGNNASGTPQQTTDENTAPLPNPWSQPSNSSSGSNQNRSTSGGSSGSGAGLGSGLLGSAGMQSLMQQMAENPQMMQGMLNSPQTQAMMRSLSENPDMAASMIGNNPLLAGNPEMQEQLRNMMPTFMQQLQNPAVQGLMSNPEALAAISQIQSGLQRLQTAAPELYTSMGMPNLAAGMNFGRSTATSTSTSNTTSTTTGSTNSTNTPTTPAGQGQNMDSFRQLMNSMVTGMANQGLNTGVNAPPPEERFQTQLETLANMGFVDRQANIQALMATYGDVNAAIDRLLNSRSAPGGQSS